MPNQRYLNLRLWLGVLALSLPILLIIGNSFSLENSISHYYYTNISVLFVGALFAFGLLLISYPGYEIDPETEKVSDNTLTNLAGIFALITAFVPTALEKYDACKLCENVCAIPNVHNSVVLSTVHLSAAALFLVIIGWMCFFRFTKGSKIGTQKRKKNNIYKICGVGIWLSIFCVGFLFLLERILEKDFSCYKFVFIGESLALLFFGVAWLTKSKSLDTII